MHKHEQTPNNDWLDELLLDSDDYINDDGFTAAVMAKLPTQPLLSDVRKTPWLVYVAILISSVISLSLFPTGYVVESLLSMQFNLLQIISAGLAIGVVSSLAMASRILDQ